MSDVERFLARYLAAWPSFDVDRMPEVVHPEATIHHSGMERPISGAAEPDYARAIKALMPDISLEVRNWAAREDVVFIEYELSATVGGKPLTWTGIGRFKLRGERAFDVIGRWDNLELLSRLDPDLQPTTFAQKAAELAAAQAAS